jgi:hypothetical protein
MFSYEGRSIALQMDAGNFIARFIHYASSLPLQSQRPATLLSSPVCNPSSNIQKISKSPQRWTAKNAQRNAIKAPACYPRARNNPLQTQRIRKATHNPCQSTENTRYTSSISIDCAPALVCHSANIKAHHVNPHHTPPTSHPFNDSPYPPPDNT